MEKSWPNIAFQMNCAKKVPKLTLASVQISALSGETTVGCLLNTALHAHEQVLGALPLWWGSGSPRFLSEPPRTG